MTREELLNSKDTKYSDWFGEGDLKESLLEEEKSEGEKAKEVLLDGLMMLIIFSKSYVCVGYDGKEYEQCFSFSKGTPEN